MNSAKRRQVLGKEGAEKVQMFEKISSVVQSPAQQPVEAVEQYSDFHFIPL